MHDHVAFWKVAYGGYPIIKQKLSERDLSRERIVMETLK